MHTFRTSLLLLSLVAAFPALAGTPINESHPLDPRGRVDVSNLKGRIQVRTWDRPEVKITGTLGAGVEKLEIDGGGEHLNVSVRYPNGSGWGERRSEPTDLQLMVPLRADIEIDSVSADVDVEGVAAGSLSIEAVSGQVVAIGAPRSADISSVSGDVRLTLNSPEVDAQTVSGSLTLSGRLSGEVTVESVSGNVSVSVKDERLREFKANTVSGDLRVSTGVAPKAEFHMETVSGNVLLIVPKNLSAEVRGETFSGDLRAPGVKVDRGVGPGASFQTRYGSGDGDISLETFSGNAELRFE